MDEFETQPQYPENTPESSATSRRNFLKVAVVSSAAAAAAVGGAGVAASALSSRAPSGVLKLLSLNTNVVSTKNACFTHTGSNIGDQNTPDDPYSDNGSIFLWAWFTLPAHSSSDNFHLDFAASTPLPAYITYQNSNSVDVYGGLSGCPTSQPTDTPIASGGSLPIDFTVDSGTSTILLQLHLNGSSVPAGTQLTLTVELTGDGADITATDVAFFA